MNNNPTNNSANNVNSGDQNSKSQVRNVQSQKLGMVDAQAQNNEVRNTQAGNKQLHNPAQETVQKPFQQSAQRSAQQSAKPVQLEQTVAQAQAQAQTSNQPGSSGLVDLNSRPTEIKIEIPTQAYFISGIRDFVVNLTKNMTGFSQKWAYRFQAVIDELCNNAIEHGSQPGKMIKITLISTTNESLEVIVEDSGTGKEKMTAQQMTALLEERKKMMNEQYMGFRGRGLPKIVGEWTDELLFEDVEGGGLRVKVKKYLRKEEDPVSSGKQSDPTHLVIK